MATVAATLGLLGLLAYSLQAGLGVGDAGLDSFFNDWVVNGLILGSAASCFVRGVNDTEERWAWSVLGLGLMLWAGASLYWYLLLADDVTVPIPSVSDALWVGSYPLMYVGLLLLVRSRMPGYGRALWLDGVISALALAAVATALLLEPIMNATTGSFLVVTTGLAYVGADLILLLLVATVFGLSGWRPGRAWLFLGLGLLLLAAADLLYLFQTAEGTYVTGGLFDAAWPAAFLLVGFAAWQPLSNTAARKPPGLAAALVPALAAVTAVVLLAYNHFSRVITAAIVLAAATLVVAALRLFLAFVENQRLLGVSRDEALKDPLTGLSNRRHLMRDLKQGIEHARPESPLAVVLLDLNGFKGYNDAFGHPAGDQLLVRLGSQFKLAMGSQGRVYRLGGDEFCALIPHGEVRVETTVKRIVTALAEEGGGFSIDCSSGLALVPAEAEDIEAALALADRRMYAQKGSNSRSASTQSRDVLMKALSERGGQLHTHVEEVAVLAGQVARRLEMSSEEVEEVTRAAELHDVGKMAIPDAILGKPGSLDAKEWAFMERHTIIGERILSAAPALRPVARIVRSTHERFDGAGYPDGLTADLIPLGARVVFVCDAFHAMTTPRPYSEAVTREDAMAELRRCAGAQFDPRVVEACCAVATGDAGGPAGPRPTRQKQRAKDAGGATTAKIRVIVANEDPVTTGS